MKQILIIILIAFSFNLYSQEDEINFNGSWLAVKTIRYKTNSFEDRNGYLIELVNDTITFGHFFYNSMNSFSYSISDSSILLADSIRIEIDEITEDSIKLIFDNESLVTFIKLPFSNPQIFTIDTNELINNSWIYSDCEYVQRIEFLAQEWDNHNDDTYYCYTHPTENNLFFNFRTNRWRIFNFIGNTYFVRTYDQNHAILHEVIKMTKDTIFFKTWGGNSYREPIMTKIESIPKSAIINIKSNLTSKIWNVEDVKYKDNCSRSWKRKMTKDRINNASFEKKMKFSFTNDSLKIYNNDSTLSNNRWDLTNDGKYIVVTYNDYFSFIEIVDSNKRNLKLKNSFEFSGLMGLLNLNEVDLELTLE